MTLTLIGTDTIAGGSPTTQCTTSVAASPGSRIVAVVTYWNNYLRNGVSLAGGSLTWAFDAKLGDNSTGWLHGEIGSAPAVAGLASGTTITYTANGNIPGNGLFQVFAVEDADLSPSGVRNAVSNAWADGNTAWATSARAVEPRDTVFGAAHNEPQRAHTPATDWTEAAETNASGKTLASIAREAVSSGTLTPGGTWATGSDTWTAAAVTYKSRSVIFRDTPAGTGVAWTATGATAITPPSGESGDLLLLQVTCRDLANAPGTITGYDLICGPDSNGLSRQWVYARKATGSDGASVTIAGSAVKTGQIFRMANWNDTGDWDDAFATAYKFWSSSLNAHLANVTGLSSIAVPPVRTFCGDCMALGFSWASDDAAVMQDPTGESGGNWAFITAPFATTTGDDAQAGLLAAAMPLPGTISGGLMVANVGSADAVGTRTLVVVGSTDALPAPPSLPTLNNPAAVVGEELSVSTPWSPTAYVWERADDVDGINLAIIAGANSATYTPVEADEGKRLRRGELAATPPLELVEVTNATIDAGFRGMAGNVSRFGATAALGEGQLVLYLTYLDGGMLTLTGWSEIAGGPFGSSTPKLSVRYLHPVAGQQHPTPTVGGAGGTLASIRAALVFDGRFSDRIRPFDAIGAGNQGTGTPATNAGVTTLRPGSDVLGIAGRGDDETFSAHTFGGSATGVTVPVNQGSNEGDDAQITAYLKTLASPGASGTGSATTSATDPFVSVAVGLNRLIYTPFSDVVESGDSGTEYAKAGSVVAAAAISAADVREAVETGRIIAAVVARGADVAERVETGSLIAAGFTSAAKVAEKPRAGAVISAALLAGFNVREAVRSGAIVAASVLSGEDYYEANRTGTLVAAGALSGADMREAAEAGVLISGAVVAGADAVEAMKAGAIISDGSVASGENAKEKPRAGVVISTPVSEGVDVYEASRLGLVIAGGTISGADVREAIESGAVVAGTVLRGADTAEYGEAGTIVSSVLIEGEDATEYVEEGSITSDGVVSAETSAQGSKFGVISAGTEWGGIRNTEWNKAGVVEAAAATFGADAVEYSRAGEIIAECFAHGAKAVVVSKDGAIISELSVSGLDAVEYVETGALISDVAASGVGIRPSLDVAGTITSGASLHAISVGERMKMGAIISALVVNGASSKTFKPVLLVIRGQAYLISTRINTPSLTSTKINNPKLTGADDGLSTP